MFRSKTDNDNDNFSDKEAVSSSATTHSPPPPSAGPSSQARSSPSPSSSSSEPSSSSSTQPRRIRNIPCRLCDSPSTLLVTRYSNRSSNGGRPYFKCFPCNKFIAFADERGINSSNPICHCDGGGSGERQGQLSRLQMNRKEHPRMPRGLHFVCATGGCGFYQEMLVDNGQRQPRRQMVMPEQFVESFARLGIV